MAAVMFRGRSLRGRRLRGRHESGEENVTLDSSKEPAENIKDVLIHIARQHGVTRARKLGYLNALVKLCCQFSTDTNLGYTKEEILCCLRVGLFHEAKEVRAACLRALRYLCVDGATVRAILLLHIDYLIVRSLDIVLDNEIERIHALRLIRKIMLICPEKFPSSLLNVMVSIANNGSMERDRMVRSCLATICELALKSPTKVALGGGINCILRSVLDCHYLPRINESLVATLLHLLNHPSTRQHIKINVDLEQLLAPFTDCHFRYSAESSDHSQGDDKENRFSASKMAIVTLIRSWPGMIRLCRPDGTGLQSLLGVLYLPNKETRKEILDILYDLFRITVPEWTDDFDKALLSTDPSQMRDTWRLAEGFVAEEGRTILPHLAKTRPNLVENHIALILSALISAGVLEALVEVITTEDHFMAVRAAILLGELLHMANQIIPHECSQHSHCLPTLVALAASFDLSKEQRNRASIAVTCLNRLHSLKKRGPIPCSLYLDQLMLRTNLGRDEKERPLKLNRERLAFYLHKESDEVISQAVKDSMVLQTKNYTKWNWLTIDSILKWSDSEMRKLEDQSYLRFIRRLIYFFKPSSRIFSVMELNTADSRQYSVVGGHLIDFLLDCEENESSKLIEDWLADIGTCLSQICVAKVPADVLMSAENILHLHSQDYFLLIGRFSASLRGEKILEKTGIFQYLLTLMTTTSRDSFIKLTVSSLSYARDGMARIILSKAMTATSESSRLYCTSLTRVLMRARVPFLSTWGMELLVMQLYDQSRAVAMEALSVISEACEEEVNLHTLIKMRPSVLHLGYKGAMLLARFMSIPAGFKFLYDANYLNNELKKWHEGFNERYVDIVDERLNEAMTTYEKTYDGSYTRRSSRRQKRQEVFVPIHLYGQLVQHKAGYQLLEKQEYICEYYQVIRSQALQTKEDITKLKAALWAVGHIGSSVWGLVMLEDENILPEIIKLAEECGVFSVRGTAFYVLGLIASTSKGAKHLRQFGWESVRHKHQELWSVIDDSEAVDLTATDDNLSHTPLSFSSLSLGSGKSDTEHRSSSQHLQPSYFTDDSCSPSPKVRPKFFIDYQDRRSRSTSDASQKNTPILESPCEDYEAGLMEDARGTAGDHRMGLAELALPAHPQMSSSADSAHHRMHNHDSKHTTSPHNHAATTTSPVRDSSALYVQRRHPGLDVVHQRSKSDTQKELDRRFDGSGVNVVHFRESDTDGFSHLSRSTVISGSEMVPRGGNRHRDLPIVHKRSVSSCEVRASRFDGNSFKQRSSSFRDEQSSSNTSSRTSKSRSDTETTSGISSCDSGPPTIMEYSTLSPIPSASSVTTDVLGSSRSGSGESEKELVHPSDTYRKLVNLKRVPSLKRRFSNPVLGHLSPIKTLDGKVAVNENSIVYTSTRDAHGYAVLRVLQRQRTISQESESDYGLANLFEDVGSPSKTNSLDFRDKRIPSVPWNLSFTSFQDLETLQKTSYSGMDLVRNSSAYRLTSHKSNNPGVKAQYVGLCLPVDVNMIFQVSEGEDKRCSLDADDDRLAELPYGYLKKRSVSQIIEDNGLEYHTTENCLRCYKVRRPTESGVIINVASSESEDCPFSLERSELTDATVTSKEVLSPMSSVKVIKSRNSSFSEVVGSVNSATSVESSSRGLSDESEAGRSLIRKEVMRLIINISSSAGVKSCESGLLLLRQKFPKAFQDLCLYSEVCALLARYRFRLPARRFIQELFQDLTFSELIEEPRLILGLSENDEQFTTEKEPRFTRDPEMRSLSESLG